MGLTSTAFIVSIQSAVNYEKRGVATASNMFMRNLGSTIGVALLGTVLNTSLLTYFAASPQGEGHDLDSINTLLTVDSRAEMPPQTLSYLQEGLSVALQNVYALMAVFAVISLMLIFGLPRDKGVKENVE